MSEIDLGDKRLNKRSGTLLAIDTANPSASIPVACGRTGGDHFYLPPHAGRKGRHIIQKLRCLRVCLPDGKRGRFEITALLAREIDPPAGEKALAWRLMSNRAALALA